MSTPTSPIDLVVDTAMAVLPMGLRVLGVPSSTIVVLDRLTLPLGEWLRGAVREHLAREQLPELTVPEEGSLSRAILEQLIDEGLLSDTLRPPPGHDIPGEVEDSRDSTP